MGGDHSFPSSLLGYDKHGVPYRWFGLVRELHSLFLWERYFWDFVGWLPMGPGVASLLWNSPTAFDIFGTLLMYSGVALLVEGLIGIGWDGTA